MKVTCTRGHIWGDYMVGSLFSGFSGFSGSPDLMISNLQVRFETHRVAFSIPIHRVLPVLWFSGSRALRAYSAARQIAFLMHAASSLSGPRRRPG